MPKFLDAEGFVWLRVFTAFALFNITAIFMGWEKINWRVDGLRLLICAFFGTAANMYLFFKGLSLTTPINGAVLMMITPLFVAVFDHIRTNTPPAMETVLGLVIGAGGAVLLIYSNASFSVKTMTGDILIAVNAMFYAVYLVLVKKLVQKYKPVTVNRATFGIGLILLTPVGIIPFISSDFERIPDDILLKIGYVLIFTSFLVYLLNAYAVKHGSPKLVGTYIYLQPLLATVIALLLDRDVITFNKIMYSIMILFGVWLVMVTERRGFSFKNTFTANKRD